MREMLAYLIARETMHQNQWQAVIEELDEERPQMPVPNSFPQEAENQDFNYVYLGFTDDGAEPPHGRWSEGPSIEGKGEFSIRPMEPLGEVPALESARPGTYPQVQPLPETEDLQ